MIAIAKAEYSFLGAGFLFVAAGSTKGCIELVFVERLLERLGLHNVGVLLAAVGEGAYSRRYALCVGVDEKFEAKVFNMAITKFDHLFEFPGGVNVQQRKRGLAWIESLKCEVQHDGGIFSHRVEHDGIIEFRHDLSNNVNALCLELF